MESADLDLSTFCEPASRAESAIVKFFVNLGFGDQLDPCKNSKFPGSMVVSVSRKDVPTIKGYPMHHIPYKPTEIVAWLHPVVHQIPPLSFADFSQQPKLQQVIHSKANCLETLDFGGASGYFETFCPVHIFWDDLDFGGADMLFGS
jgi:hypothetical protein